MQIANVNKESILTLLAGDGFTESVVRPTAPSEIIDVTHPEKEITMVLFLEGEKVVALSSKVNHSRYTDPELYAMEEEFADRFNQISAIA